MDQKKIDEIAQPKYFTAEKTKEKAGEEAFFKNGEKPQVGFQRFWLLSAGSHSNTRVTEEADQHQPGGGPEGYRQGSSGEHQEGGHARELPRLFVQLAQG